MGMKMGLKNRYVKKPQWAFRCERVMGGFFMKLLGIPIKDRRWMVALMKWLGIFKKTGLFQLKWAAIILIVSMGLGGVDAFWETGNTPTQIAIQTMVSSPTGPINGIYSVEVQLYNGADPTSAEPIGVPISYRSIRFVSGLVNLVVDIREMVSQDVFYGLTSPHLKLTVNNDAVYLPLYSVPYAIQSRSADMARKVAASGIVGTFPDLSINSGLVVGPNATPYFKVTSTEGGFPKVGINVSSINDNATLDVGGIVNAQGYRINGQDIDVALLWNKTPSSETPSIYYNQGPTGFVGIGLSNPAYMLDVAGTVNAKAFTVNGISIETYLQDVLPWTSIDRNVYRFGDVGIGITNPNQRLDVAGAIRIREARDRATALPGTIEYRLDPVSGRGDFWGYTGVSWESLTKDQGNGVPGSIAYWGAADRLESAVKNNRGLWWDPDRFRFGIGLQANMDSVLTIEGQGESDLMHVKDAIGNPILYVSNSNVGIGTSKPGQAYKLDVNGIINVQKVYISGRPLETALSSDSYWLLENNGRIFYDRGRVGIGTTNPANLLEISSKTGESAITFGIQSARLFTMGISDQNPESFIIATSGNLEVPVFAFKNQNIGIGVPNPRANFHVSGNSGVVIKGQFGVTSGFTETGEGAKLFWFPGKAAFRAGLVRNDGWDPYKLGNYSLGIGYNPVVSANYGVGLGGYNNVVLGEGAVAIGGISNLAQGAYSFAGGYQAQALHTGSFVWADYTPTANPYFASNRPNQFLIRAGGGVGIGTSNTSMGLLTVANPNRDEYVFGAFGVANRPVMLVTTSGNVGFGVSNPGSASVALPLGAKIGIGTTQPTASITVLHSETTNTQYFRLTNQNADPIMVVGKSGLVGFGVDPDTMTDVQRGDSNVFFSGGIRAEKFVQLVVEEGVPKEIEIQAYASPWNDPAKNQGNTYFTEGYVGIGTPSPNNLLELSNRSSSGGVNLNILPRLAFDIYGQDQFSLGLVTSSVLPVVNMLGFFHSTSSNPILSISQSGVGINLGRAVPISAFQVSGNVRVDRLWVGDPDLLTGVETNIPLTVRGAMSVDTLYINGVAFVPAVSFWGRNGMHIYTTNNVGIGTTSPMYPLDVSGVIRASGLLVTQPLVFNSAMSVDALQLIDQVDTSKLGVLRVRNGDLQFVNPLGETRILSSSLKQGVGNIGNMAYFVNESTIGKSAIAWNGDSNLLNINGRMDLRGGYQSSGLITTTSVQMVLPTMGMYIQSDLKNEGDASLAKSYTLANYVMNINSTWGSSGNPVDLIGINLNMINLNNSYVLNGSRVVGLAVDVSGITLEQGSTAEKYAALFNGGFVGVGTTKPSVELEVNGTISANYFSLRGGLSVPTLRVTGGRSTPFFVATYKETGGSLRPRIGVGLTNPEDTNFELSVAGSVSVNQLLISGGLTATTLNIANNAFVVASNGKIGIGNSNPDSQLSVRRVVSSLDQSDLVATQFDTVLDGATQAGNIFYFDKDIKGMSVGISSLGNSNLSSRGVGLNIDLTSLKISTGVATAKAYGLYVDVSGTGDRVAGAFMGGNVGIGVSNPQSTLHVDGSIRAQGLIVSGTLDASAATITLNEMLVNNQLAVAGLVSANNLKVSHYATINALTVSGTLAIDTISLRELNATTVLVTTSVLTGGITASVATLNLLRSQSLRIGGSTVPVGSAALAVTGNSIFDSLDVLGSLTMLNATLNVQSGTLMVTNQSRRVGIGTTLPQGVLHVMSGSLGAYNANDLTTWAPVVIQSQGTAGMASGILLSTDSLSNGKMPDSGAGIVALLGNGQVGQLGTSLLFITDPGYGVNASVPSERMRITPSGLVGIGLTNPSNMLDIAGGLTVQGDVVVNTANISVLDTQGAPLQINAANVQFSSMALFNQGITVNRGISFYPIPKPTVNPLSGQLYVNRDNTDLYYLSPLGEEINLSSIYSGPPTVIPYIDQSGSIASNLPLYWFDDRRLLQIGTTNTDAKMVIISSYNSTITGNIALLSVRSVLPDFTTSPLSRTLTGVDINLSGEATTALGANDRAIGLNVDVRQLSANRFYAGAAVSAMKYAATFLGGNVGIGLTNPNAALHIVQENASTPLFRMDSTNSSRFIEVSATGTLGINTSNATALLSIVSPSEAGLRSLWVGDSTRTQFVIDSSGQVGVGISSPQAMLHVERDIKANTGYFDWVSTNILMVGKQALVVSQNGLVGIGTSNPTAQLDVVRNIGPSQFLSGTSDFLGSSFSMMRVLFQMTDNTPSTKRFYRGNVTGLDVVIDSGTSSFGSALQTVEVTGIKLDATKVMAQGTAPITGLNVDVTGSGGIRRSAIFMGGNVGIGISNPAYALDVSGNVNINGGIVVSGEVSANRVTVDQLLVRQNMIIGGTISANVLRASTINVTSLVLTKEVISGASRFSTINATVALITTLNVGGEQIPQSAALFVSGNVHIKGVATIGILQVSTINLSASRPLVMTGVGTVVMPTVSVTGPVRVTGSLQFNPVLVDPTPSDRAQVYFKDNALYLLLPGSSQAKDLTAISNGNPGSFAYYDTSGQLSSLDSVKWDPNQSTILIGSSNQYLRLKQETTAPNSDAFIGSQYMVNIPNRVVGGGASQLWGYRLGWTRSMVGDWVKGIPWWGFMLMCRG